MILIFCVVTLSVNCFAQGKVSRPAQQQTHTSIPKKSTSKVSVSEPDGYINGHGYIDLGLPSGTKWATCNIGASSPSDNGNYYSWGETTTKSLYHIDNSLTSNKSESKLRSSGIIDTYCNLTLTHDVASTDWGGSWRMPTEEDFKELIDNCKWTWSSIGNKKGSKVTGPNGQSIFFPAAGCGDGASFVNTGEKGYYWTSSREKEYLYCARYFGFRVCPALGYLFYTSSNGTQVGQTVRAVSK